MTIQEEKKVRNNTAETFFQMGIGYALSGENEEAIGAFTRALEMKPDLNEVRMHLILLHTRLGNAAEAVRHCAALRSYDEDLAGGLLDSLKSVFG